MQLVTTGGVARILGVSADYVRQMEKSGKLEAIRAENGMRLFDKREVERVAKERKRP